MANAEFRHEAILESHQKPFFVLVSAQKRVSDPLHDVNSILGRVGLRHLENQVRIENFQPTDKLRGGQRSAKLLFGVCGVQSTVGSDRGFIVPNLRLDAFPVHRPGFFNDVPPASSLRVQGGVSLRDFAGSIFERHPYTARTESYRCDMMTHTLTLA